MKDLINYSDFKKVDIRVGTIISAEINNTLLKPSIVLKIDFGKEIGIKKSLAQLTKNYNSTNLINKQIAAVINFQTMQIGNFISEVLVLGFPNENNDPILVGPYKKVLDGGKLY